MKPAAFGYARAETVDHAVELLGAAHGEAAVLAGGQSLGPTLNLRLARPRMLIDIKRIAALREVAADDRIVAIGAAWTHAEIEDGAIEDPTRGLLGLVARGIAYRAIRNRGTLGGSLVHADPAADWLSAMAALSATVVIRGANRATRRMSAAGFVQGAFTTALGEAEVLTAVEVPRLSARARWGYSKICRKQGEFAKAIGVAVHDPATGLSSVLAGALDGPPVALSRTAERLRDAGAIQATALVMDELSAVLPGRDAAVMELHAVAVRRALSQMS